MLQPQFFSNFPNDLMSIKSINSQSCLIIHNFCNGGHYFLAHCERAMCSAVGGSGTEINLHCLLPWTCHHELNGNLNENGHLWIFNYLAKLVVDGRSRVLRPKERDPIKTGQGSCNEEWISQCAAVAINLGQFYCDPPSRNHKWFHCYRMINQLTLATLD